MAIGFTPKHTEEIPLLDLTPQQFIALGIRVAESLGWNVFYVSRTGFKAETSRGIFSRNQLVKLIVTAETVIIESLSLGTEMVDFGRNKKLVNQLISKIEELSSNLSDLNTDELQSEFDKLELVGEEEDDLLQGPTTASENFKGFLSIFMPRAGYYITPILLNLNLLVFILMILSGVDAFSPDGERLIKWGANFKPVTTEGEPWRLITNCFLHIGILHLLMNMYALVFIGAILEPYMGKVKFAAAYILTGIVASTVSLWWHDMTISAGASGAIFGMYGVFLALLTTDLIHKDVRKSLLTSILVFVAYNLVNGLKGGIDNAAHIGGLLSGIVVGYSFLPSLKKRGVIKLELTTILLLGLLVFCSSFMVYNKPSYDFAKYDSELKSFINNESMALEIFNQPADVSDSAIMSEIKDRGIYYWNENITLLNRLDSLYLPEDIQERNSLLIKYCELRIKSYELLYKGIEEGKKDKYNTELQNYNVQIEEMIKKLTVKNE